MYCGRYELLWPVTVLSSQREAGLALVGSALILSVVAILIMCTQHIVCDSAATTLHAIDRQLAYQSAEAALADAKQAIMLAGDIAAMPQAQCYGHLTGAMLPHGAKWQSKLVPQFQIALHPLVVHVQAPELQRYVYRVTAKASGFTESTQVFLQADFIRPVCNSSDPCEIAEIRRIAWRILDKLPSDWIASDVAC